MYKLIIEDDEGKTTANYNLVRWSTEHCLYRVQS